MTLRSFPFLFALLALCAAMFSSCKSTAAPANAAAANAMVYVCDCAGDCTKCDHVSKTPGKCGCGHDLVAHHVLALEGSNAKACSCGGGCDCKVDPNNASKCTCGKPVKTISLAGKGFYTCTCGGACGCSLVMPGPGKCGCGKDLVPIK